MVRTMTCSESIPFTEYVRRTKGQAIARGMEIHHQKKKEEQMAKQCDLRGWMQPARD